MSKTEKRIELGDSLYFDWVVRMRKIYEFGDNEIVVATPKTNTLLLFALLYEKGERPLLLSEMCREFTTNFEEGLYADRDSVFIRAETSYEL